MTDKERLEEIKNNDISYLLYGTKLKDYWEWLIEQAERVRELEEERSEWKDTAQSYYMTNQELREQNKRYREALEFYANEENYKPFDGIFLSSYQNKVDEDGGEVARKALEGESSFI